MIETSVATLARLSQRFPKTALFGVAAVVQLALLLTMVFDRVQILRDGTEVTLQTQPIDPRDVLRGDYVILRYDISRVQAGSLQNQPAGARKPIVFVKLAPNREGFYEAVSVHTEPVPVTSPEVLIRGRVFSGATCGPARNSFCDALAVRYDLESYFVPEGQGRELEQLRNERKLAVVAAVTPAGRAAIKRLQVDGKPIYDEPWF